MRVWLLAAAGGWSCRRTCGGAACPDTAEPTLNASMEAYLEAYDALPPCDALEPTGSVLDVETGCVDGGCAGATLDALEAAWGPGSCGPGLDAGSVHCAWPERGLVAGFDAGGPADTGPSGALDDTGAVDEAAGSARWLELQAPSTAVSEDGLGVSVSLRCVLLRYGLPDRAVLDERPEGPRLASVSYDSPRLDAEADPTVGRVERLRVGEAAVVDTGS